MTTKQKEAVNHPDHYKGNKYEAIDIILDYQLNFLLGNSLKYLLRCNKKDNKRTDLEKCIWYLQKELETMDG